MNLGLKILLLSIPLCLYTCSPGSKKVKEQQEKNWSVKMAESVMARHDSLITYTSSQKVWQYDIGMLAMAINRLNPIDAKYGKYMKDWMDHFIEEDGSIRTYRKEDYNLDNINPARNLLILYKRTGEEKYKEAIRNIVDQFEAHPTTKSGGFWHKKKYPWQMWLDGIYMSAPFLVRYAKAFDQPEWYDVITHQIILIHDKTVDEETGLLYHAWDESREQAWSDNITGKSKHFWSRAMGWYIMALVDVLEVLPQDHPDRDQVTGILQQTADALLEVRDDTTGLWYQVLDHGGRSGNYLEGSGSAMFLYAFAKGAKKGYLDPGFLSIAEETFQQLTDTFIREEENGLISMVNICGGCGLGGTNPYRDGSYEYYVTEDRVNNDPKGVGPFILAAIELGV